MSPLPLRRYRAERLLREEFDGWRARVLATVRGRLRASGVQLDVADLESSYAQAWAGLYAALLDGREVANPIGWLTVVTFRRAIDEHRSRAREQLADVSSPTPVSSRASGRGPAAPAAAAATTTAASERDLAAELDNRAYLRHVFEAFRGSLSVRECEAASLCYLQGLPRAEAAQRMGIGERAMRKLMEGRGPGRPGVAGKVGALLGSIRGGEWCEQQASLMRAFAFGVLDPDGERYQLALAHRRECPACRRYVLSLRGLAAVLPPLALPWGLGAGAGVGLGGGAGAGAGGGAGAGAGTGATGAAAGAGTGAGTGTGLGLGGGVGGAKLAVGCVLALGVGCAAVAGLPHRSGHGAAAHRGHHAALFAGASSGGAAATAGSAGVARPPALARTHARRVAAASTADARGSSPAGASEPAQREFGPEHVARTEAPAASGASSSQAEREFGP